MEQLGFVTNHRIGPKHRLGSKHRRVGSKHRTGTPGLVPYRHRTIDSGPSRRRNARHLKRTARRIAGSQVAMALGGATALVLLVLSGYRAAEGAAIVLGMF